MQSLWRRGSDQQQLRGFGIIPRRATRGQGNGEEKGRGATAQSPQNCRWAALRLLESSWDWVISSVMPYSAQTLFRISRAVSFPVALASTEVVAQCRKTGEEGYGACCGRRRGGGNALFQKNEIRRKLFDGSLYAR
jgi:hypothetical protein